MKTASYGTKDLDRLVIINKVSAGLLTQEEGARELKMSSRQLRRLIKNVHILGNEGIKGRKKGGNRKFNAAFKAEIMAIVRQNYADFGAQFASEKLFEINGLKVNKETLRQWMIEDGLWVKRTRKKARIHQSRERRPRFGELIQIDGSPHDWFEGRAPKCCLLVFIDDATSHIVGLLFTKSETSMAYFLLMKQHVMTYGRPVAYYSDKHGIFRVTRRECVDGRLHDTQVGRALRELQIELICAHSPQAKGRVERANQTLQDRLVKELRLRGISTIEGANSYLPEFITQYNKKFSVKAANLENAHRPVHHDEASLKRILSFQHQRRLSKNLELSFQGNTYQIITKTTGYRLRHKWVQIYEHTDGAIEMVADGQPLDFKMMEIPFRRPEVDFKELNETLDAIINNEHAPASELACVG